MAGHFFDIYIFFVVVLGFCAVMIGDKGFLSVMNLFNIARTTAMITVIAVAMTFVISAGELDLSVGSTTALAALVAGLGAGIVGGCLGVPAFGHGLVLNAPHGIEGRLQGPPVRLMPSILILFVAC